MIEWKPASTVVADKVYLVTDGDQVYIAQYSKFGAKLPDGTYAYAWRERDKKNSNGWLQKGSGLRHITVKHVIPIDEVLGLLDLPKPI